MRAAHANANAPSATADTPTVMVLHRRVDALTIWRDITGKLSRFCRLVRVELSEETLNQHSDAAPAAQASMIQTLGGLVALVTAHSDGIHIVSDSYGSPVVQGLVNLRPRSVRSISYLDVASRAAMPQQTRATDIDDGDAAPFLTVLRRHLAVASHMAAGDQPADLSLSRSHTPLSPAR